MERTREEYVLIMCHAASILTLRHTLSVVLYVVVSFNIAT